MVEVIIKASSRYPIRRKKIQQVVEEVVEGMQIDLPCVLEIEICGDRKIRGLKRDYLGIDHTTDVLSFPLHEWESVGLKRVPKQDAFIADPDGKVHLGNLVVCYAQAQRQANLHKLTVDEEINQLIEHGLLHLLGYHHE